MIQAAVDHLARLGGGTVLIKAGTYRLRNAVYLQGGVHLRGEGTGTQLIKEPSNTTALKLDSDWPRIIASGSDMTDAGTSGLASAGPAAQAAAPHHA